MSTTYTRSTTDTYTEARARYVMGKVYDDLINLVTTELITKDRADKMRSEILYLLDKKALSFFEFQFTKNGSEIGGLHYKVKSDSSISIDDASGNINLWPLYKQNVDVTLLVQLDYSSLHINEVREQLRQWGWGVGSALSGSHNYSQSYSKDGFGVAQSIVGKW